MKDIWRFIACGLAIFWSAAAVAFASKYLCVPLFSAVCGKWVVSSLEYFVLLQWLKEWQTLVGAGLAIVAAWMSVAAIKAQIAQAERHETERRRRQFSASRAILPLTLSRLTEYAASCAEMLGVLYKRSQGEIFEPESIAGLSMPKLPSDVISELKDFVNACDEREAEAVANILRHIQIQSARIQDLFYNIHSRKVLVLVVNVENYIIDAARLHAMASSLFDFARGNSPAIANAEPSQALIRRSLILTGINENFPRIHAQFIDERT
jgi:hypothetical protein